MHSLILALALSFSAGPPASGGGGGAASFPVNGTTATMTEASGVITASGSSVVQAALNVNNTNASCQKLLSLKNTTVEEAYFDAAGSLGVNRDFTLYLLNAGTSHYFRGNANSTGKAGAAAINFGNSQGLNSDDSVRRSYSDNFNTRIETLQANGNLVIAGTLSEGLNTVNGNGSIYPQYAITLVSPTTATTQTLPSGSQISVGARYTVKDAGGTAGTNNITVSRGGTTIDGASSYVINTNYGFASFVWDGTNWSVVAH